MIHPSSALTLDQLADDLNEALAGFGTDALPQTPEDDMDALSLGDLVVRARTDDMGAFEVLRDRLEPQIRRYVRRLVPSNYAEEDILQDVFLALYLHLERIDPPENVRPYLFRMARNRCYDELRSSGRREILSLDDDPVRVSVSFTRSQQIEDKPDDLTHWLLLHLEVQEAIDQLPEAQRMALILYAEENLSYAEVAEVMEVKVGTIKSRIFHAKQNLRRLLPPETLDALDAEFE